MNGKKAKAPSVILITITMILLWPVGICLLIRRLVVNKTNRKKGSIVLLIMGAVCIMTSTIVLVCVEVENLSMEGWFIVWFYICLGIMLILAAIYFFVTERRYKRYYTMIVNENAASIASVSEMIGLPEDRVVKDIRAMIKTNCLENTALDIATGKLTRQRESSPFADAVNMII